MHVWTMIRNLQDFVKSISKSVTDKTNKSQLKKKLSIVDWSVLGSRIKFPEIEL